MTSKPPLQSAFKPDVLRGKTAFVAGGTSGINLGIARRLAQAGASVAVLSRSQDKVDAAVKLLSADGSDAFGVAADVRDYAQTEAALAQANARWGGLDIVISGAAGNFPAAALGMSSNAFRTVVEIDLIGTFNVFRASYAFLRKPGASLIAITAPQGRQPMPLQSHVCAAKAGVDLLTQCLAMEWGEAGVRVNGISPGPIAGTEGMARLAAAPEIRERMLKRLALHEFGEVEDVAETALFLCTDSARYVTGAIYHCDGGSVLGDATGYGL
jgi:NAD(P)-dependent dehydrogenase (short-subunit alcohol dehydrogenase family)